jgi:sec-independent protein translocase protein TatA
MGVLQPGHLILILVIVLIVFGPGKMSSVGADVGKALRDFRRASEGSSDALALTATAATRPCASCSTANASDAKFCTRCGAHMPTAMVG